MLTKIRNVNFVLKVVKFHGLCTCRYKKRAENMQSNNNLKPNSAQSSSKQNYDCHVSRQFHAGAFKTICCFIANTIIEEKEVHNVKNLNNHDQEILYELGGSKFICTKS